MAASAFTKRCRRLKWLFMGLDALFLSLPLLVYVIIGLTDGEIVTSKKVALVSTILIALILTALNIIGQKRLRCPIWIVILGLFIAIRDYLMPLIIILAITSVLDDLVFTPLIEYYRTKTIASRTIDQREVIEGKGNK